MTNIAAPFIQLHHLMFLQISDAGTTTPGYFLWPIAAFLLGALLVWLYFWRTRKATEPLVTERDRYRDTADKWEKELLAAKRRLDESQRTERDLRANLQRCEADKQTLRHRLDNAKTSVDAGTVLPFKPPVIPLTRSPDTGSMYEGLFDADDFRVIEGIGQRVTTVLHEAGYTDWSSLAVADIGDLREMLAAAGNRYSLSDPANWPHQAKLAADGKWDELIIYQKSTDGSRDEAGEAGSDSKFEKLVVKKLGFSSANPKDLKVVDGVGPKIEKMLKDAGIVNWKVLAATGSEQLTDLLSAAGNRYRLTNAETWPRQAALAVAGNWQDLKDYQQELRDDQQDG